MKLKFLVDVDDTLMSMDGIKPVFNTKLINFLRYCGITNIVLFTKMDANHSSIGKPIRLPLIQELRRHGITVTSVITPLDIVFLKSAVIPSFQLGDAYKFMLPVEMAIAELRMIQDIDLYDICFQSEAALQIEATLTFLVQQNVITADDTIRELEEKQPQINSFIKKYVDDVTIEALEKLAFNRIDLSLVSFFLSNKSLLEKNKEKPVTVFLEELRSNIVRLKNPTALNMENAKKFDKYHRELLRYRNLRFKCYSILHSANSIEKQMSPTKGDAYRLYVEQGVLADDTVIFIDDNDREHASLQNTQNSQPTWKHKLITIKPPNYEQHFQLGDTEANFRHNVALQFCIYLTFKGVAAANAKNFQLALKCFKTAYLFCKDLKEPDSTEKARVTVNNILTTYQDMGSNKGGMEVTESEIEIDSLNNRMKATEPQDYHRYLLMREIETHKRQHPDCYYGSTWFGYLKYGPEKLDNDFETKILNKVKELRSLYANDQIFLQNCSSCLEELSPSLRFPVYRESVENSIKLLNDQEVSEQAIVKQDSVVQPTSFNSIGNFPADIIGLIISYLSLREFVRSRRISHRHELLTRLYFINLVRERSIAQIATGLNHVLFLKANHTLWSSGDNSYGKLGLLHDYSISSPQEVLSLSNDFQSVQAGWQHSLALNKNGTLWAWGDNKKGQLGLAEAIEQCPTPKVTMIADIQCIVTGMYHSLALKNDGTVWAWGKNRQGGLGLGEEVYKCRTPQQIVNLTNVKKLVGGLSHSFAFKQDGTIWAWGRNSDAQLGLGNSTNYKTPQQFKTLTGVKDIAAGDFHCLAIKDDGTLWAWGKNQYGQLGLGHTRNCSTPSQVRTLNNVRQAIAGHGFSLIINQDGSVWAWGCNIKGQLGLGHTNNCAQPQQVMNLTNVKSLATGIDCSIAIKKDGDIWISGAAQELDLPQTSFFIPCKTLNYPAILLRGVLTRDTDRSSWSLKPEQIKELLGRLNTFASPGLLTFTRVNQQQLTLATKLKQFIEAKTDYHSISNEIKAYVESNQKAPSPNQIKFDAVLKEMLKLLDKAKEQHLDEACISSMEKK